MRVLVVEDDPRTSNSVRALLEGEKMAVDVAAAGEDGLIRALRQRYDVMLLDLGLPDTHGFDILRKLRAAGCDMPVMLISGTSDGRTKAQGLWLGGDDYIVKPYRAPELLARISAVVRRARGHAQTLIQIGDLTVNLDSQWAERNGCRIHLSSKEYGVLELLALRRGQVVSREALMAHLYGVMDAPNDKIIEVFVSKLRKKLQDVLDGPDLIETIWGRGYMLCDPDGAVAAVPAAA